MYEFSSSAFSVSDSEKYCAIAEAAIEQAGVGQDSHMAIDYELVLTCGINGIIEKIDTYLQNCDALPP